MEMYQIRYFLAVCDARNFTRAAQSCHVSQPSLTQAIKKLEEELGGELLVRAHSGCRLTALGRLVEPRLRQIYESALNTTAEAVRFSRLERVPLRIGVTETIGARRLGPVLARFQREFPNAELELIVVGEKLLFERLQTGVLDLAVSPSSRTLGIEYRTELLYEERYAVVFHRDHPFNAAEGLNLKTIESEPYLDRLNCELREQVKALCSDRDIHLYAAYRSNNEDWILNMVRAGIGIALMPEYTIPGDAEDIAYRYLDDPRISRRIYAVCFKKKPQQGELAVLLDRLTADRGNSAVAVQT